MFIKRASKKVGLSPGTLTYVGEAKEEKIKVQVFDYDKTDLQEKTFDSIDECLAFKSRDSVTWINISGIHEVAVIEELGRKFNLHPLLLEDVVNTEQRPKVDDFDEYLFVILKMLYSDKNDDEILHEQISLILMPGLVISLQEYEEDVFDPVRERIRKGKGRIRTKGADYLLYALIDIIVDHYFHLFETIGEKVESLHEQVVADPRPATLQQIQDLKRKMIFLRKSVWPLREMINILVRGDSALIEKDVILFLRDVYDHTIQVIDTIETYRDMLSGMMDIYLSSVSNRMNEIMKVLTVIATIFIPLTFIAGVYGMNFKFMPELELKWAYPVLWLVMIGIFVFMVTWFKRKKWL